MHTQYWRTYQVLPLKRNLVLFGLCIFTPSKRVFSLTYFTPYFTYVHTLVYSTISLLIRCNTCYECECVAGMRSTCHHMDVCGL